MAFGSPDSFVINPKVYADNSYSLIKFCGTQTNPASVTKSTGLPADAQLAAFFARRLESSP
jgi:hypothetical protein